METILIVEDDRTVRHALKRLFEYEGYKVEVSGDGQSAFERFHVLPPTAIIGSGVTRRAGKGCLS